MTLDTIQRPPHLTPLEPVYEPDDDRLPPCFVGLYSCRQGEVFYVGYYRQALARRIRWTLPAGAEPTLICAAIEFTREGDRTGRWWKLRCGVFGPGDSIELACD